MDQLCDRYTCEVLPGKAPATRKSNEYSLKRIRKAFAGNRVAAILPMHIYQYRDAIGKWESQKKANLDLEVLSHMFTKAIEWGIIHMHPMTNKKVTKFSLKARRVRIDQAELVAFAATLPRQWQLYISLKLWTGRRKGELLRLTRFDIVEQGMRFVNNKNPDDEFILEWEPETRAIIKDILNLPGYTRNRYLFHTRNDEPYIKADGNTSGFDTIWQRYMVKAINSGKVKTRFTEHDIRKVRASQLSREQAQHLLRHTTPKQTETYQVEPTLVSIQKSKK
jgi:integrase